MPHARLEFLACGSGSMSARPIHAYLRSGRRALRALQALPDSAASLSGTRGSESLALPLARTARTNRARGISARLVMGCRTAGESRSANGWRRRLPTVQASFLKVRIRIGLLSYVELASTTIEHYYTLVKWYRRNLHDGARGAARSSPLRHARNARMSGDTPPRDEPGGFRRRALNV